MTPEIRAFHATEASYEWLMGGPSAAWFRERALKEAVTLWGPDRPTLVHPFPGKDVEYGGVIDAQGVVVRPGRKHAVLPKYSFMAWLYAPPFEPVTDGMPNDGSHLVVLWWGSTFSGELPPITDEDWKAHAKDYGE